MMSAYFFRYQPPSTPIKIGFTLIEVLMTTAIMSIMTLLSWQTLNSFTNTYLSLETQQRPINEAERLFTLLEHDLAHRLPETSPDQIQGSTVINHTQSSLAWHENNLQFNRLYAPPYPPLSVRYQYQHGQLYRHTHTHHDNITHTELLSTHVTQFQLRFWQTPLGWQTYVLPPPTHSPRGIEITLTMQGYPSPLQRIVYLP